MTRILIFLFSLSFFSVSFAQVSGNSNFVRTPRYRHETFQDDNDYLSPVSKAGLPKTYLKNDSTLTISANILLNRTADSYTAIFGISQMGESIETAHGLMNERLSILLQALSDIGISKEKVYTDVISQIPVFETEVEKKLFSRSYNEKPIGFEIRKNIHIPFQDINKLDPILAAAAKAEIYDIIKVEFYVRDIESIYDTLRKEAIRLIKEKRNSFEQLGVKPTAMFQILDEAYSATYPEDLYEKYKSQSSSSLTRKETGISYNKLKQSTEPVSFYYEKTSYGSFDKVIDPEIVAPAAQFSYSLTLQYTVKRQ